MTLARPTPLPRLRLPLGGGGPLPSLDSVGRAFDLEQGAQPPSKTCGWDLTGSWLNKPAGFSFPFSSGNSRQEPPNDPINIPSLLRFKWTRRTL